MKQQRNSSGIILLIVGLVVGLFVGLALGLPAGAWVGGTLTAVSGASSGSNGTPTSIEGQKISTSLIDQAQGLIDKYYVDRAAIQANPLTYGAISGMVDALGDTGHSRFMSPQDVQQAQSLNTGQFIGIGIEVEMRNGNVVVVAPISGTPADKAGIKAGDIIEEVDGTSVQGMPLSDVSSKIRGKEGTQVTLTLLRPSTNKTLTLTITRAVIPLISVTWSKIPGTTLADIRISEFSQGVSDDLAKAIDQAQKQNVTGIVLDLRDDPGGLLDESVASTSYFLTSGNVLEEKNAQGQVKAIPVKQDSLHVNLPMVVLINQGSASASEIMAGALQDAKRAQLVGETTFGTGTVLNQFPLQDGSALLLAVEEWLTPGGRVIWHKGIDPDQKVTLPADTRLLLPEDQTNMTPAQLQSSGDTQLLKAVSLLGGQKP